jgi:hypothetical protein
MSTLNKEIVRAPEWASELVTQVCSDLNLSLPQLRWERLDWAAIPMGAKVETGTYLWDKATGQTIAIVVREKSQGEQTTSRISLIHELAHHYMAATQGTYDHSENFWQAAWTLHEAYGRDLEAAIRHECAASATAKRVLEGKAARAMRRRRRGLATNRKQMRS